jgi:hypothetical protein
MRKIKIVKTKEGSWKYEYHGDWNNRATLVIESIKCLENVFDSSVMRNRR